MSAVLYACRSLRRAPGLLAAIVLTLALGIGANTAVYSLVHTLLVQPPPYRAPDRLALVWARMQVAGLQRAMLAGPEVLDFKMAATKLSDLAAIRMGSAALTGDGDPEQLRIGQVGARFFDVLGVNAARGRTFAAEDDLPSPSPPVVVTWAFFQRRFGGAPDAVGRQIILNGSAATLIGVLPPDFRLQFPADTGIPDDLQLFRPFSTDIAREHRGVRYYHVVARLADGVTMAEAAQEVEAIAADLARRFPMYTGAQHGFFLVPLLSDSTRAMRPMLLALLGGVMVVLVVSCVNVAGLLLARAAARRREVATLVALGADRRRLAHQFVAEGLLIAGLGAMAGIGTGALALRAIVALRPPGLDRLQHARIDTPVLVAIAAIACVWGLLFALAPLIDATRASVAPGLRTLSPMTGRLRARARSTLVVAQIALGTVLVVTAGLLVRTIDALHRVDVGFDAGAQALTFRLALPAARYPTSADVNAFNRELESRLAALPGVRHAGAISHVPFDDIGNWASKYFPKGPETDTARNLQHARLADTRAVSPGAMRALGVRLVSGRWFTEDDDQDSRPVVVVDESLAARAWPGRDPIGQPLHVPFLIERQVQTVWAAVIGVVRHVRHRTPDAEVREQVYFSSRQNLRDSTAYIVRTAIDPAAVTGDVRRVVSSLDGLLPAYAIQPLTTYVERAMSARRFTAVLIASFAMLALALAGVGLAGLIGYSVAARQREFGIRLALGATPRRVRAKVLAEALVLVSAGVGLGVLGAAIAANGMRALFFGVAPFDLPSYAGAIALLGLTGVAAAWWPARRASGVNPVEALRAE